MRSPSPGKKLIFSLILLGLGYAVLEAAAYLYLSVTGPELFSFSRFQSTRARILDAASAEPVPDLVIPLPEINAEVIHPYLGFVIDPELREGYSRYGFRGEEPPAAGEKEDVLAVGVFGGSFAEGLVKEAGDILIEELARRPGFGRKSIHLYPIAAGGYKQPQQMLALAWFAALGRRFDVVINLDGFNEVALPPAENDNRVFHAYPRGWPARVKNFVDPRRLSLLARLNSLDDRMKSLASAYSSLPFRYSVSANLVWRALHLKAAGERSRTAAELEAHVARKEGDFGYLASGPAMTGQEKADPFPQLAGIWSRASLAMHQLALSAGASYHHFLQPNQYVAGSKRLTAEERRRAFQEDHPYREGVVHGYPLLRERGRMLEDSGVHFEDLTGIFRDNDESLYRDTCCHVTPRGYALVARAIGRSVVARLAAP